MCGYDEETGRLVVHLLPMESLEDVIEVLEGDVEAAKDAIKASEIDRMPSTPEEQLSLFNAAVRRRMTLEYVLSRLKWAYADYMRHLETR